MMTHTNNVDPASATARALRLAQPREVITMSGPVTRLEASERDCEWPGDMDDDLDAAAQQIGRPLSGPETDAFCKAFRVAYAARMRVDLC